MSEPKKFGIGRLDPKFLYEILQTPRSRRNWARSFQSPLISETNGWHDLAATKAVRMHRLVYSDVLARLKDDAQSDWQAVAIIEDLVQRSMKPMPSST